jgi:hypothetical protein
MVAWRSCATTYPVLFFCKNTLYNTLDENYEDWMEEYISLVMTLAQ